MQNTEKKYKILAVDDGITNLEILKVHLSEIGYAVDTCQDGDEAINYILELSPEEFPDLILLDVEMPGKNGYEVCKILKNLDESKFIPVILVAALEHIGDKVKGFDAGANDYLTKPYNKLELFARIDWHLKVKKLMTELDIKNNLLSDRENHLMRLVEEKTVQLHSLNRALVSALETANLMNDEDTENHIVRVGEYAALLAEALGCDSNFIKNIRIYAPLHDIGKVGIDQDILQKPGRYTPEEFDKMKKHVAIGARILHNPSINKMAKNIALYHHEKWDGSGYINKLKENNIPLEARIAAIADVYDALTTKRVYKDAFPEDMADDIIREGSGKHFDPIIVKAFFTNKNGILEIKNKFSD